ncbi:MAG TPA: Gfo/Idh/MocA family oxidoreductase [Puia sp.]|nr:Gfo/Idh/MocA family oxidoreductase [Puia sp.]
MIIETNHPLPLHPRPVVLVGAGGIANTAHLPAYRLAGFQVAGVYDIDQARAAETARAFAIPAVYRTPEDMLDRLPGPVVFDLAIPGSAILPLLRRLPEGAAVLMQKPMGEDLAMAREILSLTRERRMVAGVNFQLRYAPFIHAARTIIGRGLIGRLCEIEVNVNVHTPWNLWEFLYSLPRVEILYHSIHYIDLVRTFLGNPAGMYARTTRHPAMPELASVRSSIIMDYGEFVRANILTNHCHDFGLGRQHSYIRLEGDQGVILVRMGVLMDYPNGVPETFEFVTRGTGSAPVWKSLDIDGTWFPNGFIGSMAEVMRAAEGTIGQPDNSVEDAIQTMACVEAAYESNTRGGVRPDL